jgi:hypothetical protein
MRIIWRGSRVRSVDPLESRVSSQQLISPRMQRNKPQPVRVSTSGQKATAPGNQTHLTLRSPLFLPRPAYRRLIVPSLWGSEARLRSRRRN